MSNLRSLQQLDEKQIVGVVLRNQHTASPAVIARSKLLFDLMQLGIRPFDQNSVDQYKKSKVAVTDVIAAIADYLDDLREDHLVMTTLIVTCVATVATFLLGAGAYVILGVFFGVALATIGLLLVSRLIYTELVSSKWVTNSIEAFTTTMERKVPQRVLDLARRIGEVRPDVQIEVESFKLDPFLVVRHPTQNVFFTVAVWDEMGYVRLTT